MFNAQEAAAKTAMAKIAKLNGLELDMIQQRIAGAAAAGDSKVLIELTGNVYDKDTSENIRQVLIDAGYTVALNYRVKTQTASFQISW